MKANLLLYDYPLEKVDEAAGACMRYSCPDEKTFSLIIDLLEGFDTVIVYTDLLNDTVINLIIKILSSNKKIQLK